MTSDELNKIEKQQLKLDKSREERALLPEDQLSQLDTGYTGRPTGDAEDGWRKILRRRDDPRRSC